MTYTVSLCERQTSSDCVTYRRRAVPRAGGDTTTSQPQSAAAGDDVEVVMTGLKPQTSYVWTITMQDSDGEYGFAGANGDSVLTTQPPPSEPSAVTGSPSSVGPSGATLTGSAFIPSGQTASATFEYGTSTSLGSSSAATQLSAGNQSVSAAISGLSANTTYYYRLKVVTANGKTATGAVTSLTTDPPPDTCPSPTRRQTFRYGAVRASGCLAISGSRFVARGDLTMNGLVIQPSGGSATLSQSLSGCTGDCAPLQALLNDTSKPSLYYDGAQSELGSTRAYTVDAGSLRLRNGILDETAASASGSAAMLAFGADASLKLLGFPVVGFLNFTPKGDDGGLVALELGIPFLDGIAGSTSFALAPDGTMKLDGISVDVGDASYKVLDLGELQFRYSASSRLWSGSAIATLPIPQRVKVGVNVTVQDGRLTQLGGLVDSLNQHLADGVFLQKIGLNASFNPFGFTGTVGLSAGPKVLGAEILGIDGTYSYVPAGRQQAVTGVSWTGGGLPRLTRSQVDAPPSIRIGGALSVASIPLSEASAQFWFASFPWVTATGKAGLSLSVGNTEIVSGSLNAGVTVWNQFFAADGSARVRVLGYELGSAYALITKVGGYGCGSVGDLALGFSFKWGEAPRTMWGCSTSTSAIGASARAAVARRLTIPRGAGETVLRFTGAGGDPEIRLRAPDGRTIAMPPTGRAMAVRDGVLVARDPTLDQTVVQLRRPAAGRWTYDVLKGSVRVTGVRVERVLASPRVRASVVAHGAERTLRWKLAVADGERVRFVEAGGGVPPRTIVTTSRRSGAILFTPALVDTPDHAIDAYVERADGLVRARLTVARFRAAALTVRSPRPVRLRRRADGTVAVTWRPSSGAARYDVFVTRPDGTVSLQRVPSPRVSIPNVALTDRIAVAIQAVAADGRRSGRASEELLPSEPTGGPPPAPRVPPAAPVRKPAPPGRRLRGRTLAGGVLVAAVGRSGTRIGAVSVRAALRCVNGTTALVDRTFKLSRPYRVNRYRDRRGRLHVSYGAAGAGTSRARFHLAARFIRYRSGAVRAHGTLTVAEFLDGVYCESGVVGWGAKG